MEISGIQRRPSVLSPVVDFLCVGGLSLIILVPLLLSDLDDLSFIGLAVFAWLQALINYSHFMASYRLVYRDRETIRKHRWAAIGVPLLLVAGIGVAVLTAPQTNLPLTVFFAVASGYLAWHYTGQTWGMMSAHAVLGGLKYDVVDKFLLRGSLRVLLAWHVVWFLHTALRDPTLVGPLYEALSIAAVGAFLMGVAGLARIRARTGRFPPTLAIVAWLAIFAWYAALARWGLAGLFLVQLFHALQYLEFPVRVEINRAVRTRPGGVAVRVALYAGLLAGLAGLMFLIVPGPAMSIMANLLGAPPSTIVPVLILYAINIHHYFTDGVIWKLSNPEVRKELFSHVTLPAGPPPAPLQVEVVAPARKPKRQRR